MPFAARLPTLLAAFFFAGGCHFFGRAPAASIPSTPPALRSLGEGGSVPSTATTEPLAPSPRLIVGRIIAVDAAQGFAFIELASDAPRGALTDGAELNARTPDLKPTGRLQVSRYVRGRTLGTRILAGQPSPGDEVVWLAP